MGRSNKFWSDPSSFLLFALLSLIPLRGLFLIAARQSVQAPSALAPQRRLLFYLALYASKALPRIRRARCKSSFFST